MRYEIPKYYLEKLEKLVKSLQKKTDVKFEVFEDEAHIEVFELNNVKYRYKVVPVELELDYKLGEYTLVAQLEHTDKGNIINQINQGYDVPKTYRDVPCRCEHCQSIRNRKSTFLLVDSNNNFKQVGKNCLNEYTGIDAEYLITKVNSLNFLLHDAFEQPDEEFMQFLCNTQSRYCDIKEYANQMVQLLNEYGYDKEKDLLSMCCNYSYNKDLEPRVDELLNVVNTDWYNDDSNYCYNVKMLLSDDYMETRHSKLLLSYLNSAMIYLNKQVQKELEKQGLNNEYLGNVGDKVEFEIKSMRLLYTRQTNYSWRGETSYVYKIITTTNSVVIWKTSTSVDCDNMMLIDASTFKGLKGTIKELSEYKGEKQTIITRGKPTGVITHQQRVEEHRKQHPEEYETFNGKVYHKDSSELAMDKFLAEC